MENKEAQKLMNTIAAYVDQNYTVAAEFFKLILIHSKEYPTNCFYTGLVYRKTNDINNEIHTFKSCSKHSGLSSISVSKSNSRIYQFVCKQGFDLANIILYLHNQYQIEIPSLHWEPSLLERVQREGEIIARISKRQLCRIKTN